MLLGGPLTYRTLHFLMIKLCISKVSNTINIRRSSAVHFSDEQKKSAVIELCTREGAASSVAEQLGTSRSNLYKLKKELLGERNIEAMRESSGRATSMPQDQTISG
jgi:transposase-like protein